MKESHKVVSFDDEELILVNSADQILGYANKETCHVLEGQLHRAFSIFILNSKNQVLLQKRSSNKKLWPSYWANSCCSHPRRGETTRQATQRRLQEELGLQCELKFIYRFEYQAQYQGIGIEKELCSVFVGKTDLPPNPNPFEIEELCWIDIAELSECLKSNPENYTPWLHLEWKELEKNYLEHLVCNRN